MGVDVGSNNQLVSEILDQYPIPGGRPLLIEAKNPSPSTFSHHILFVNQSRVGRGDPALDLVISLWILSILFLPLFDTTFLGLLLLLILTVYSSLIAVFEDSKIGKFFQFLLWVTLLVPPVNDLLENRWEINQFVLIYMIYFGLLVVLNSPLLNPLRRRYSWWYTPEFSLTTPLLRYDNLDSDELTNVVEWLNREDEILSQFLYDIDWSMNPAVIINVEYLQYLHPIMTQFWQDWGERIPTLVKRTRPFSLLQQIPFLRMHSSDDPLRFDAKLGLRIRDFSQIAVHEIEQIMGDEYKPSDYYYVDLTVRGDSVILQTMELIQQSMTEFLDHFFTQTR